MGANTIKRFGIFLQILVWLALFFSPVMFLRYSDHPDFNKLLVDFGVPTVLCIAFYLSYLWITPKYLLNENNGQKYTLVSVAVVIFLTLMLHVWFEIGHQWLAPVPGKSMHGSPRFSIHMLMTLRDMFNIAVSMGAATALLLTSRYSKSEKARKEVVVAMREAELKNLRNQINPHFLLNTLNNIYALIEFDRDKAQKAIMELSKLLRHLLYDNQQELVNLKDEAEFMHNYIDLMKIRLAENVTITENFNLPDPCHVQVAPLIFISLVENAFKHGISPTDKSFITVDLTAEDGKIICQVINSNFPKNEKDRSGNGIGLHLIRDRLSLTYPDQYEWIQELQDNNKVYASKIIIYDFKLCNN